MSSGKAKKEKRLSGVTIRTAIAGMILLFLISIGMLIFVTLRFTIRENGNAQIRILEEINQVSHSNRDILKSLMEQVLYTAYPEMTGGQNDQIITEKLYDMQEMAERTGLDTRMNVILSPKRILHARGENAQSILAMVNSYWYIRHRMGDLQTSWSLRLFDDDSGRHYYLSYAKTVVDRDGAIQGVIVVSILQDNMIEALQGLIKKSSRYYILDDKGIVVCHTNTQLIGNWLANMESFRQKYGYNTSRYVMQNSKIYLVSNYHDFDSGWTYVEWQNLNPILFGAMKAYAVYLLALILSGGIIVFLVYYNVRRAIDPITSMTEEIDNMQADELHELRAKSSFREAVVLVGAFNQMVARIREMIENIRLREAEKRKTEYDFLQAQLSPHFIHNTLLTLKSLILMGRMEEANRMLTGFMPLMHIPLSSKIPFVVLREEFELLENYAEICNIRMNKKVKLLCDATDAEKDIFVPRMILQPLVGNAFFHGFSEMTGELFIRVEAEIRKGDLFLRVIDNGEGMTKERLEEIQKDGYQSMKDHHGVGIRNIRRRLRMIYGEESEVRIESCHRQYTLVELYLPDIFAHQDVTGEEDV